MNKSTLLKSITAMMIALVLAAGQFSCVFAEDEAGQETDDNLYLPVYADYDKAFDVISRINSERSKSGVAALTPDQTLMDAALVRAAENILYFEHARPNGGTWDSVSYKVMGENLGRGTGSTAEIMRLWMASEGHRENIVRSAFHSVGVACIEYDDVYYWVQLFGTSGGSGAGNPGSGTVSAALDLPREEDGGSFALDYSITGTSREDEDDTVCLHNGSSLQLGLRGDYLDFDASKVRWEVSDSEVASVDEGGVLKVTGRGHAKITASSGAIERASLEIDTRDSITDMYIIDAITGSSDISDRRIIEGTAPRPEIVVLGPEGQLTEGEDYKITYTGNDMPGAGSAEVRGIGSYKDMVRLDFNIRP